MTDAGRPALEAWGVTAGYGEMEILHGVSVCVRPGEIVSMIGPNGAGKSTFLKAIFGLLPITAGEVRLEGRDITGLAPERIVQLGLCYVPQTDNVFPSLTIQENLEIGAYARRNE